MPPKVAAKAADVDRADVDRADALDQAEDNPVPTLAPAVDNHAGGPLKLAARIPFHAIRNQADTPRCEDHDQRHRPPVAAHLARYRQQS